MRCGSWRRPAAAARPPVAAIAAPAQAGLNVPITFDGSGSSDPDSDALSFSWAFSEAAPLVVPP